MDARTHRCSLALCLVLSACSSKSDNKSPAAHQSPTHDARSAHQPRPSADTAGASPATTINAFFQRGNPTFVRGTRGDATADHRIAVQVGLIRGLALPAAKIVTDTSIDSSKGIAGWPANPVLYGGENVNAIVAALAPSLPYRVDADHVAIGGEVFKGDGYRLVVATPTSDAHPAFVLFAGTGEGGIAEINAGIAHSMPIAVADRFGTLVQGHWVRENGRLVARLGPRHRRIPYRSVTRTIPSADNKRTATITFRLPQQVPRAANEDEVIAGCMRGIAAVIAKLDLRAPTDMWIYLYPDRASKAQLTGNGGHGHAVPSSRTLHMLAMSPLEAQSLVTHEATHVLGYYGAGPAGTPLMGEGMAVWVSGRYASRSIATWAATVPHVPVATLLGPGWLRLPEATKYPLAGLLFDVAVRKVGLAKVTQHLLGAAPDQWDAACVRAGTSAKHLDAELQRVLANAADSAPVFRTSP